MTMMTPESQARILVDAHVHIYDCFNLEAFFDSALKNFQAAAQQQEYGKNFQSILLLTETQSDHYFRTLAAIAHQDNRSDQQNMGQWSIHTTQEDCSVYVENSQGVRIYLIAGRQVVTSENLEVLALLTAQTFEDGSQLEETIDAVISSGGIPVIPWGFGKWIGTRGTILTRLLDNNPNSALFMGDNGGRPVFWPLPPLFKQATQKGLQVLPGTDPLPFASESRRPGSFGFAVEGSFNRDLPALSLKQILLNSTASVKPYGIGEQPIRFLRNQVSMQIVKRTRSKA
ncbi:MAG: hypothetical protein WBA13_23530 [Microcoleaceae cyanobacterium]